jgi:hypothetical protein
MIIDLGQLLRDQPLWREGRDGRHFYFRAEVGPKQLSEIYGLQFLNSRLAFLAVDRPEPGWGSFWHGPRDRTVPELLSQI